VTAVGGDGAPGGAGGAASGGGAPGVEGDGGDGGSAIATAGATGIGLTEASAWAEGGGGGTLTAGGSSSRGGDGGDATAHATGTGDSLSYRSAIGFATEVASPPEPLVPDGLTPVAAIATVAPAVAGRGSIASRASCATGPARRGRVVRGIRGCGRRRRPTCAAVAAGGSRCPRRRPPP
jgi:hypothetical protein